MADTVSEAITPPALLDEAKQAFIEAVQQLPSVSVDLYRDKTTADQTIRVVVPNLLGPEIDAVYAAEVRTRRQFPRACLNIDIEEARAGAIQPTGRESERI